MRLLSRFAGLALIASGTALFSLLLWDATDLLRALELDGVVSEAAVALLGLFVAALAMGTGAVFLGARRAVDPELG